MSRAERIRFQRIARHFHNYQREFQALKEQEGEEEWRTLAVQALEENITLTEHTLELIRQKHGVKAERMTRDWLLEHKTQAEIAAESGISERHVRRLLEAYLNDALGEDK
jgi:AraC-like DNA-binding protein